MDMDVKAQTDEQVESAGGGYQAAFIALLLGALGFTVLGQQIFSLDIETRATGTPFIVGGVALFALAYRVYQRRAIPGWLNALTAFARLTAIQLVLLIVSLGLAAGAGFFAGDHWKMINPAAALIAWFAALGLAVAAGHRTEFGEASAAPGLRWTWREVAALALLGAFALAVRAVANGSVPGALTGDEGSAGLTAVDFAEGRMDNPFIVGWYSFPSLYFLAPVLPITFLGHTYQALRLPSALAGALTVVGLYWMARPIFGRAAAGLGAAMLAALNFHIHFSRVGLNNIWDGLFAVLALGLFWRAWHDGRWWQFSLAGLLVGLSQYFYTSARLLPLIMIAWFAWVVVTDRRRARQNFPGLISMVVAALATFLPMAMFFAKHPEEFLAPMGRFSILSGGWLATTSNATGMPVWLLLLNNFRAAALAFTSVPLRNWYESGQPMLLAIPASFFILGAALAVFNWREPRYWMIGLWLLGVISIGALTHSAPAAQRYVIGAPVAALLVAIPLATIVRWVAESQPRARLAAYAAAVVVMLLMMAIDLRFYFAEYIPAKGQGDINTQVAGTLGKYLADYPPGSQVYCLCPPRMGFFSFSTVPYLAPRVTGHEVSDVVLAPPEWTLVGPRTAFVFLPERAIELATVAQKYPGGETKQFYADDGTLLFVVYEIK